MRFFLLSSFPSLSLAEKAPISFDVFRARCADHLSEGDLAELDGVCATPPQGKSAFARDWTRARRELRNLNDLRRARRLPPGTLPDMPAEEPFLFNRLRDDAVAAWEIHDPLRRELALLLAQWNWIDGVRRNDPFSAADLLGYALQLRLLEQKQRWTESDGLRIFNQQSDSFMTPLLSELREHEISA